MRVFTNSVSDYIIKFRTGEEFEITDVKYEYTSVRKDGGDLFFKACSFHPHMIPLLQKGEYADIIKKQQIQIDTAEEFFLEWTFKDVKLNDMSYKVECDGDHATPKMSFTYESIEDIKI